MRVLRWVSNVWVTLLVLNLLLSTLLVGGRHVLPMLSTEPRLLSATPPDGARDVPVRARPALQFDQPMNPRSVERALQLAPPTPALLIWDRAFTTLTISPTLGLTPATDYQLSLAGDAMSRRLRPIGWQTALRFRTIAAPAVQATIPTSGSRDVPTQAPLLIAFSRTMVPVDATMRTVAIPELQIDPPVAAQARWIDQATLLIQPYEPLAPDTSYRITIATTLTDLGGGPLGQAAAWEFRTAAPRVLEATPPLESRDVGLRTPLTVTLTQALSREQLLAGLVITPTTSVAVEESPLPGGGQLVRFTPTSGWELARGYQAELRLGEGSAARWGFTTAPRLALTGRFPGEGQVLPADQEIRLVFSAPVDPAALQALIQIDPPDSALQVRGTGGELRVDASLRAATAYTLTISPDLADRNGVSLGAPTAVRFVTAPAEPRLGAPEADHRLVQHLAGSPLPLLLRRTNISLLSVELYGLDEATAVRTLVFDARDWSLFDPARYQQPLLRSWTQPLSDTLNAVVEDRMLIEATPGEPLPPGLYYLRARTPEGPSLDLILSVTRASLALQLGATGGLVWATDAISGTVLPGLPVAIYQDDALILEGVTDRSGLLPFSIVGGVPHIYTALARGPAPALMTVGPLSLPPTRAPDLYRIFIAADRSAYQPGETIRVGGAVRQVQGDALAQPSAPVVVRLRLLGPGGRIIAEADGPSQESGAFGLDLPIADALAPGQYQIQVDAGGATQRLDVQIATAQRPDGRVRVVLPPPITATGATTATLVVESAGGVPLAQTPISWTLLVEPSRPPLPEGYVAGGAGALALTRSGDGVSDARGQITIPISVTQLAQAAPLRYTLRAESAGATGGAQITAAAPPLTLGVRPPPALIAPGAPIPIDAVVINADGDPAPGVAIQAQLLRTDGSSDRPIVVRRAVTGADGAAAIALPSAAGSAFIVRVIGADPQRPLAAIDLPIWVTGRPQVAPGSPALIADRRDYTAGDSATLLPLIPEARTTLLTIERAGAIEAQVRTIRPGDVLTATLAPDMAPATEALLRTAGTQQAPATVARATLPVAAQAARPAITIAADRETYTAGATAALTITVQDAAGAPLPADLLVAVVSDDQPLTAGLALSGPYARSADHASADTRALGQVGSTLLWSGPVRSADAPLTLSLQLPGRAGQIRVVAWAASDSAAAQAERSIMVEQPIALYLELPPFLRPDDQSEIAARIVSSATVTQTAVVRIESSDLSPADGAFIAQRVEVPPLGSARVIWAARAGERPLARVSVVAETDAARASSAAEIPLVAPEEPSVERGALVEGRVTILVAQSGEGGITLDLAASPDAVAVAAARRLAERGDRSVLDTAALLLISAPLTETRQIAREALRELVAAQREDGGWGWWPTLESQPAVTAVMLEALAAAADAGLPAPERARALGIDWAERAMGQAEDPSLRAQLAYALVASGRSAPESLAQIDPAALSAQGSAALLLASSPDQAQLRAAAIQRLEALALRDSGRLSWLADPSGAMDNTAATAMVGLALERADAADALTQATRQAVAEARGVNGWGDPLATARALQFLRAGWPDAGQAPGMTVDLNGERLLVQASALMTSTYRIELAGARLRASNTLTIITDGGPLLLSYRLGVEPQPAQERGPIQILSERVERRATEGLQSASLSPGAPLDVRVTLLVRERIPFAQILVPLPPGATPELSAPTAPLTLIHRSKSRMILAAHVLEPGIYELRYTLRPTVAGTFSLPPPELRRGGRNPDERPVP